MIETLDQYLSQFADISPAVLSAAIVLGVNLLLRRTPKVPNWTIPYLSIVAGMAVFYWLCPLLDKFPHPVARNLGMGFLAGIVGAFGYGTILRFAETRWPWLNGVLNGTSEKPAEPPEKPFSGPMPPPPDL